MASGWIQLIINDWLVFGIEQFGWGIRGSDWAWVGVSPVGRGGASQAYSEAARRMSLVLCKQDHSTTWCRSSPQVSIWEKVCVSEGYHPSVPLTYIKTMTNAELSMTQLEACAGGWYLPAAYIIAKEGAKAVQFYKDAATNSSQGKSLGTAVVSAGHRSGTIDDWDSLMINFSS